MVVVCNPSGHLVDWRNALFPTQIPYAGKSNLFMKPKFLGILQREYWFVVMSRSLLALVVGILCWPAFITLLDLYDAYSPILEVNAPAWLLSICVFSIVVSSGLIIWSWLSKPNLTQIALDIEKNNPDLRDQLNCAVELEGKSKKRKREEKKRKEKKTRRKDKERKENEKKRKGKKRKKQRKNECDV